jgi:hypothetical protein
MGVLIKFLNGIMRLGLSKWQVLVCLVFMIHLITLNKLNYIYTTLYRNLKNITKNYSFNKLYPLVLT